MDERTTGLIVRTRPLTDTSLIVHWLTPDLGRVATAAKGALRPKSPLRGKLDLFFLADFSFARSRRSDLHTLREVALRQTHPALRRDLDRLEQACHGAALIEQATETETPLPAIFELFTGWLGHLAAAPLLPQSVFAFELKLLAELGLAPDLAQTCLSAGARALARQCLERGWPELARLRLSAAQVEELRRFLRGFLTYHLDRVPPGRWPAEGARPA